IANGASVTASTLTTGGTGLFSQTGGSIIITGTASFGGASTVGQITGGTLTLTGSFAQLSTTSTTSFVASGTHRTLFTGTTQTISFANPGGAASHFADLELDGQSATLSTDIAATGALIVAAGPPTV